MPPAKKSRKPKFALIEITGAYSASPRSITLRKRDWVCWINPKKTGGSTWKIRFTDKNPLVGLGNNAEITVKPGQPSKWFRLKRSVKKGDKREYKVSKKNGPAPGPEIISGD